MLLFKLTDASTQFNIPADVAWNPGLNTILIGKGERGCRPLRGEKMIWGKDECDLRRTDRRFNNL